MLRSPLHRPDRHHEVRLPHQRRIAQESLSVALVRAASRSAGKISIDHLASSGVRPAWRRIRRGRGLIPCMDKDRSQRLQTFVEYVRDHVRGDFRSS
jgi:hypothetical protein